MNESSGQRERIIRFNPWKLLLLFAPLGVLVAISMFINFDSWRNADTWVYVVFGSLILFLIFGFVVMPYRYYLRLTPEGLTIQYLTKQKFYSWAEVSNFRVVERSVNHMPAGNRVVWDLTPDSPNRTALLDLAATINRYDASVLATFGMSATQLADLLNAYQFYYTQLATEEGHDQAPTN